MAAGTEGFVLGKDEDAAQVGIYAIRKSDINDAVETTEGNGGLGPIPREGPKPFTLTTCEKNSDDVAHIGHVGRLPNQGMKASQCTSIRKLRASGRRLSRLRGKMYVFFYNRTYAYCGTVCRLGR